MIVQYNKTTELRHITIIIKADPPGFEPESEAPEASMLSKLYYES